VTQTKLKVLQVLPALESGGVERGTLEIADYLVKQGHESIVISAGGRLVNKLMRQGSKHISWPIGKKSLLTLRLVSRLRRFLIEQQVDILHARSRFPAWIAYFAWVSIPKKQRPKFITTVHGKYSVSSYSGIMTKGEAVIVVSEMIKDYVLKNYHLDPSKLTRIYRGINTEDFVFGYQPSQSWKQKWYSEFPNTKNAFVITLPARITRWKGQEDFLELISLLRGNNLSVHGLIVGEAKQDKKDFLASLNELAKDKGIYQHVSFVGHRSDLREVLAISDVVMSMSTQPEAFGRTTIEALSLGVPVIGYAHGGVDEQLQTVFPAGRINVGDIKAAVNLIKKWIKKAPVVNESHPYRLLTMQQQTLSVYLSALKKNTYSE